MQADQEQRLAHRVQGPGTRRRAAELPGDGVEETQTEILGRPRRVAPDDARPAPLAAGVPIQAGRCSSHRGGSGRASHAWPLLPPWGALARAGPLPIPARLDPPLSQPLARGAGTLEGVPGDFLL